MSTLETPVLRRERRLLAVIDVPGRTATRVGLLYAVTGVTLVALMGVLGLVMRLAQGEVYALEPSWFYRIMTLHGAGMLAGALLAHMGVMWYAVRGSVALSVPRAAAAYVCVVGGSLVILAGTLIGGFAPGWTFLFPLPFLSRGAWDPWTAWAFLIGLLAVGVGFMVFTIDLLARASARWGSLARAVGVSYLRGRDADPPPPQAIAAVAVAIVALVATAPGVTLIAALLGRLLDGGMVIDALWAKNLTYSFGHTLANLILYVGIAGVYVLVPRFSGRPWHTTKPIVIGWLATIVIVLGAYGHHLYLDFAQPKALSAIGTIASSAAAIPILVVTVYSALMLVWRSSYRWTLASTLLYLGFAGWTIGGAGAVLDSMIPLNFRLHNTMWVPGHFHTYLLLGVVFWALAFVVHLLERAAERSLPRSLGVGAPAVMTLGGAGLVTAWYISGALGVPRRYAVQPFGSATWSLVGAVFALVFAVGFLLYLAAVVYLAREARRRPAPRGLTPEPEPADTFSAPGRPVLRARELFLLGVVMTVAPVALLPPVVEAAGDSVRYHHLAHAAMFLAGAAAVLALSGVREVWERWFERLRPDAGLALAIVAPVVSLLAMTPRFYGRLEEDSALHFGYHLVFFVGLGAVSALGASRLGRPAAWLVGAGAVSMGVIYAAGVSGG